MSIDLGLDRSSPVVERTSLEGAAAGNSAARLERVVLADGRRLVLKHLPRHGDWLTRTTDGAGRLRRLWDDGILHRVSATVDHAVVAIVELGDTDVVVMRDVADVLLPPGTTVSMSDMRRVLAGLAALHQAWEGCEITGLCNVGARYAMFAPAWHAADDGPGPHPARAYILSGWEAFADLVPEDVAEAMIAVHEDPAPLAAALRAAVPSTLVHGDAKIENLGFDGDRLVAIDWGELTGIGPAEIDVAWFTVQDGWRFTELPDELFAAYDEQAARPLDPQALDLACIGSLAQFGFKLAGRHHAADEWVRARAAQLLRWWVSRVGDALGRWSPV